MICTFYVHAQDQRPQRVGPVTVRDQHEARRLASALSEDGFSAVDVWTESGELFRVKAGANETVAPIPFRRT